MAQHQIRWKRGDYIRLGRAVADFNRKINKLQAEENRLYLPDLESYAELRDRISTRAELNRMINSLRAFQKEGAEDLYTFESGQQVTKWEQRELTKLGKRATATLQQKIAEFHEPFTPSGFSKAQMRK